MMLKPIIQKKLKKQLFGDKNRKKKIKQAIDNDPRILKIIERKVAKGFKQESIMKDKRIKKYTKQIKDSFNKIYRQNFFIYTKWPTSSILINF